MPRYHHQHARYCWAAKGRDKGKRCKLLKTTEKQRNYHISVGASDRKYIEVSNTNYNSGWKLFQPTGGLLVLENCVVT